jgi:hypothetical protein
VRELERRLGRKMMEVEVLKEALAAAREKSPSGSFHRRHWTLPECPSMERLAWVPHQLVPDDCGTIIPIGEDHLLKVDRHPIHSAIAALHICTMDLTFDLVGSEERCSKGHIVVVIGHKPQVRNSCVQSMPSRLSHSRSDWPTPFPFGEVLRKVRFGYVVSGIRTAA